MATKKNRPLAVLKLSNKVLEVLRAAHSIVEAMTGNPAFSAPVPTMAIVTALIDALHSAQITAATRARGSAEARDVALKALKGALEQLRVYVQQVADAHAVTEAASVIASAGMAAKKSSSHAKADLSAVHGASSGMVNLAAKAAGHKAMYEWQWSPDQHTWTGIPTTLVAKASVSGLAPGAVYYFRFRSTLPGGAPSAWSQVISLALPLTPA